MKIVLILLLWSALNGVESAQVDVSDDGPAVTDIPITFTAVVVGDVALDVKQFVYQFDDSSVSPSPAKEINAGRTVNLTLTYGSNISPGEYDMKVQVFAYIWGMKAWEVANARHKFKIQSVLNGFINISQNETPEKSLRNDLIVSNRTTNLTAIVKDNSHFFVNASANYTWIVDNITYKPSYVPLFTHNFTKNANYSVTVIVAMSIKDPKKNSTITRFGKFKKQITAKSAINDLNVSGNTWLPHGALLSLNVNCSQGSSPFWYCWDIFSSKVQNYSCSTTEIIYTEKCNFSITRYLPRNGTYYIAIGVYNDVDYQQKTILVNVYNITPQPQLSFIIIPIVSSILAIVIVVGGIAYHLQQRQRYNITLEVADFDFQRTEDLNEKTFFERIRESFSNSMRVTLLQNCISAQNYEDFIDDTSQSASNYGTSDHNTSNKGEISQ